MNNILTVARWLIFAFLLTGTLTWYSSVQAGLASYVIVVCNQSGCYSTNIVVDVNPNPIIPV